MLDILKKDFDENETYKAYNINNVYKCNNDNLAKVLSYILQNNNGERILIQIPNTKGLTDEMVDLLTDNIDVRIIGGLTQEYSKTHNKGPNMDNLREKATYSKYELKQIMSKIKEIESKIDNGWNDFEKALYLCQYIKYNIVYRKPGDIEGNMPLDTGGNTYRTRTWDTLLGLVNGLSTCSGFSHIYQELCERQNIKCVKTGGKYVIHGSHAWNYITIDNKNYLVDTIWDAIEFEKGNDVNKSFGIRNVNDYEPRAYKEIHSKLDYINQEWIDDRCNYFKTIIPKLTEEDRKNIINHFLETKEQDKERMNYLVDPYSIKYNVLM